MNFVLPLLASLLAVMSLLTFMFAPSWMWAWKLTILVGEFGHWLVVLPLAVAGLAANEAPGGARNLTLLLCAVSVVALLRPVFSARRLAARLPAELDAAFGGPRAGGAAWSWARLYRVGMARSNGIITETFARPEGQELKLDFYPAAPSPGAGAGAPCIVVIHGGGWDGGDRKQLAGWNGRWAARGYAVAAISYRLAPRWQWPAQSDDVRSALAWLKAQAPRLGLDPTRLVLLGRSAGGQIATAVGYGLRDPAIRGVVALYAPHDMPFVWSVSREGDALNSAKLMRQYMGGPPEDVNRERYHTASGQLLAEAGSPPTLLAHGTKDTLSWERHSARLTARLAELSVGHFYLQLPWGTHGFDFNPDGPGGQLASSSIERFLDAVMRRGAAAPRVGG
jgi:acetyl esterase/lipase